MATDLLDFVRRGLGSDFVAKISPAVSSCCSRIGAATTSKLIGSP